MLVGGPPSKVFFHESPRSDPLTTPVKLIGADGRTGRLTITATSLERALVEPLPCVRIQATHAPVGTTASNTGDVLLVLIEASTVVLLVPPSST